MATNRNFRVKNGLTIDSITSQGILSTNATGDVSTVTIGTANQVLAVNSSANGFTWVAQGGGGGTTTYGLTIGTTGLAATSGSSPFNGGGAVTIDIDTSKVPRLGAANTFTGAITLAPGTNAPLLPLKFLANTSTPAATDGAMDYDGTIFYQTSNTTPGKALATQQYYYASSSDWNPDFSASGAAKSMLGGATTGITVAAGTTYEFEFYTTIQHQYVTTASITGTYTITSTTVSLSPTVAFVQNVDYGSNTTNFTTATTLSRVRTTGGVTFSAAISSGSRYNFLQAKGIIRVTGTGTAKIYPSLATSQGGASDNIWTVQSGTVFKLTPIGNGTATTVGTWS